MRLQSRKSSEKNAGGPEPLGTVWEFAPAQHQVSPQGPQNGDPEGAQRWPSTGPVSGTAPAQHQAQHQPSTRSALGVYKMVTLRTRSTSAAPAQLQPSTGPALGPAPSLAPSQHPGLRRTPIVCTHRANLRIDYYRACLCKCATMQPEAFLGSWLYGRHESFTNT